MSRPWLRQHAWKTLVCGKSGLGVDCGMDMGLEIKLQNFKEALSL